ncbi:MAG: ThuA domain-containing protein, partial [Fimbriimonas sp.]
GWKSDNYHQFPFGLVEKDGWLYGSLSTAIDFNAPGLSGPNSANRGTVFRVDPKRYDPQNPSANIEFITGGSRTPNGLILGPGGELFVGENQGAWMPNNKYNHIEPGKFFGFYSPTAFKNAQYPNGGVAGPYDSQPLTPPTVSIPQNEAGNSPAGGVTIAKGEFAGQMLTTDVRFGGLQRVWLDKVNGQLQGGIIPFTQGLESGTNRLVYGPDGSLYYGGIGATDTWAWVDPKSGKWTQFGLQRLRPNGKSTFEIHSMVATPTGFRLNLNRAVPKATLENPGSYYLQQWHYEPTEEYGGDKKGIETLKVTKAVASADRKSVLLTVPNLKEWRTVELRTSLKSDKGENLWAGQLWYTLNQIPGRDGRGLNVLVFSKTAGFRHDSIPTGQQMFRELGAGLDWKVTFSEDASIFTTPEFKKFQVVVFLNTTGDILNREQEVAFEGFIRKGGGFLGIHSAADCEYDWPFYGKLVGGYFLSHPAIQKVDIVITDRSHPATIFLPPVWTRTDELYDYKALPDPSIQILARLDTTTYQGHKMGPNHPFMWCHSFEGGRGFYTGMGHTKETYSEPKYREMIKQAVFWVAGQRS